MSGALVLVATPIGNLGDLSPRAVEVLRTADHILCEDTRRTRALLSASSIPAAGRLSALHAHNEAARLETVMAALAEGRVVALVSDAGTPGISDPGVLLVRAAIERGIEVTTVPGPSAVLAALAVSGLPTDRFVMEGFLPRKGSARTDRIAALGGEVRTAVLFESPKRVAATLEDLLGRLGPDRPVAVARELTKVHEEVWRGTLAGAVAHYGAGELRGEVVIVLGGAEPEAPPDPTDAELRGAIAAALADGMSTRDAAGAVAELWGVPRRRVYELATRRADDSSG